MMLGMLGMLGMLLLKMLRAWVPWAGERYAIAGIHGSPYPISEFLSRSFYLGVVNV